MRAVVFVNGEVNDYSLLARWVQPEDYLIGADGGTLHILALGLQPHVVVGDLDSLPADVIQRMVDQGVDLERFPTAKDQTDLELAVERGLRDGASDILLVGALGGRLDQTLANLLLLAQRDWPVPVRLAEGSQIAQVMRSGDRLVLTESIGNTVSAIPLSPTVTGITYNGLEYPLHNATLAMGSTRGVSNVIVHSPATITIDSGLLLIVHTEEPQ